MLKSTGIPLWRRQGFVGRRLPGLVLAFTLLLTAVAVESARQLGIRAHLRIERELADDLREAVERRFDVNTALLSSVVGLFNASQNVDRQEFQSFFRKIEGTAGNLSGIQGVGFARFVPAAQLKAFEASVRAEGPKDFRVFPEGQRQFYGAIEFLQPSDWRNQRAIGYDMYSNPVRQEAMKRAVFTDRPSLSGRITLLQEGTKDVQPGVLLFLPIFRHDNTLLTPGKAAPAATQAVMDPFRRLQGWAYSPLRMADLMRAAMATVRNPHLKGAAVMLYDGNDFNESELLFSQLDSQLSAKQKASDSDSSLDHASTTTIKVGGRIWSLNVQLGRTSIGPLGFNANVWLTMVVGLGISGVSTMITWLLVRNHQLILSELKLSQLRNRERALASTVFEQSTYGISITDPEARLVSCNEAFCQLTGYARQDILGRNLSVLQSDRHDPKFYRQLWEQLNQRDHWEGEVWNRRQNGDVRRHELTIKAVRNRDGKLINYVGMLHDVSNRYQQEAEIRYQARHDYLTGLPNRAELIDQMDQALARAKRYGVRVALLFLDLDGFKPINDRLGHATGDLVLQTIAVRLQEVIRQSDTLARQGGDEFVLLIPQASDQEGLMALAQKLQKQVELPMPELEGISLSVSMGIALFPDHAASAEELLRLADSAMYQAKQQPQGPHGHVAIATTRPVDGTVPQILA